ncbi:hypothetical protein F5Y17DRAFT_411449 [Xylariaceae sp. FL0594]|nr:hypothetical protein F5Y17DRAFT_411449 [Xylariaceae sp. FL0594]
MFQSWLLFRSLVLCTMALFEKHLVSSGQIWVSTRLVPLFLRSPWKRRDISQLGKYIYNSLAHEPVTDLSQRI